MKKLKGKRILAYFIDIFIIGLITSLLTSLPIFEKSQNAMTKYSEYMAETMLATGSSDPNEEELLDKTYQSSRNFVSVTILELGVTVLYFGVYGFIAKGETLGKKICKIKIVNVDETKELNPALYLLREIIKCNSVITLIDILLLMFASKSIYLNATQITSTIGTIIELLILGVMVFRDDERGLHDLICQTKVISTKEEKPVNS